MVPLHPAGLPGVFPQGLPGQKLFQASTTTVTKQQCQSRLSGLGGLWTACDRQEGPIHRSHRNGVGEAGALVIPRG